MSRHGRQPDGVAGLSALWIRAARHRSGASCRGRTQRWNLRTRAVRPLSYERRGPRRALVGPGLLAVGREIVGVGLDDHRRFVRLMQAEGDAVAFGVFDRLFLGVEGQAEDRKSTRLNSS